MTPIENAESNHRNQKVAIPINQTIIQTQPRL